MSEPLEPIPPSPEDGIVEVADEQLLAKRLKEAREFIGLSQEQVAEKLKIPRPAVTNMEAGKRKVSCLELKRLAALYRQPYEYFVGEPGTDSSADGAFTASLFRTTRKLSSRDREQLLKFAQFLEKAGKPAKKSDLPE